MCNALVPLIIVVVCPLAYFAIRLGLLSTPTLRWSFALFLAGLVLLKLPLSGLDMQSLDRLKLLVAAWVVLVMILRHLKIPWWMDPRRYRAVMALTAMVAACVYLNFFSFHGARHYMHLHEVAHYYLGSKYFDELEYGRLYVALARAELEDHGEPLQVAEARDLSTNAIVPIREILSRGDEVRGRFTPERWADFRKDADFLRDALASSYGTVLKDHGFNPSPLWALLGGFLANRVPAGSPTGIFVLTLLDPLLLVTAFVAVGLSFGLDAALLTISYFTVIFGASFGWIGGAYLRYLWFAAVILGACFLKKEMYRRSGALLAFASGLRIFPSLLIAGLGLKATREFLHDGHIPVRYVRFFTSFLATATILFATTLLMSGGLSNWAGFQQNMGVHVENAGSNLVGLTSLIAYLRSVDLTAPNALEALTEFRRASVHLQLVAMLPVVLLFVTLLCSRVPDFAALALGIPLIITTLNLSAYYYSFLLLLLLAHMKQPLKVAMIFGVEASMYVLQLFEQHDAVLYVYRGILLLYLVAATHLDLLTVELREVWAARPSFLRSSLAR